MRLQGRPLLSTSTILLEYVNESFSVCAVIFHSICQFTAIQFESWESSIPFVEKKIMQGV